MPLIINVENEVGCVNLLGAVLLNAVTIPNGHESKARKIAESTKFVKESKAIDIYADCVGYSGERIRKSMLKKLSAGCVENLGANGKA